MSSILESNRLGPIHHIWLNRPAKRNALCRELVRGLTSELQAVAQSGEARVVVLGGRGGAFSAGGDLDELVQAEADAPERLGEFHELILSVVDCPIPVVLAWQGAAAGFGGDLALAADLRLGDPTAFFQASFVHVGLIPDGGGTYFLPEWIGAGRAYEWMGLGERVSASVLEQVGILNRVFSAELFESGVEDFVQRLSERAPRALRELKRIMNPGRRVRLLEALAASRGAQLELLKSADFREGVAAFREKRAPKFSGR